MKEFELTKAQQTKFDTLKLTIELVPRASWGNNIRDILTRTQWDKLRKEVFKKANSKCEICGGIGTKHPVEGHEIWEFDDDKKIQSLKKIIAICPLCHQVKHIKLTYGLGKEYGERAYNRFKDINNLTDKEAEIFYHHYLFQWEERCKIDWHIDMSKISEYGIDLEKSSSKKNVLNREKKSTRTYRIIDKNNFKCPICEGTKLIGNGKTSSGESRFKCKGCNKTFTSIETEKKEKPLNFDDIFD